jgi:hypothetical protein
VPFYVDRSGSLFEANPETQQDLDSLLRQGLAPATEDDKARHNEAEAVKESEAKGFLDEGGAVDTYTNAALRLTGGLGTVASDEQVERASGDEARIMAQAHPVANALGRSVPLAPIAAGVGLATGGVAGLAGGIAGTAGAALGEGAVEGIAQEYDDAWLEQRPMELQKVATNTLLFAGTDGILRGVLGAAARAMNPGTSMVVRRNIVAEAAGRAANTTRTRSARDVAETIGGWVGGVAGTKVGGPLGGMAGRRVGRKIARSLFGDVAEEGAEAAAAPPHIVSVTSTPNPPSRVARETVEAVPEPVPAPQAAPGAAAEAVAGDDLEAQLAASIEAARARKGSAPAQGLTPATRKPEVPQITRSRGAQHFGPDMPKSKKVYGPDEGPDLEAQLGASVEAVRAFKAGRDVPGLTPATSPAPAAPMSDLESQLQASISAAQSFKAGTLSPAQKQAADLIRRSRVRRGQLGAVDMGPLARLLGVESPGSARRALVGDAQPAVLATRNPVGPGATDAADVPDIFAHYESIAPTEGINPAFRRLTPAGGKTPGGVFLGSDGVKRYVKMDKDPVHSLTEVANDRMYRELGRDTVGLELIKLPDGKQAVASELMEGFDELSKVPDWSKLSPSVAESYARGLPADHIMGNWDMSRNSKNYLTDGTRTVVVDAGEAGANAWDAQWFKGNVKHTKTEIANTIDYRSGKTNARLEGDFVGSAPSHRILHHTQEQFGDLYRQGLADAEARIAKAGGVEGFIAKHYEHLAPAKQQLAAKEMKTRIAYARQFAPIAGALLYLGFSGEEDASPGASYAGALREISTAGSELTARRARQFLGKREPSGKGALTVFAGGLGISAALEKKREELDAISSDPTQLIESLSANTGDLVQTHPAVFQAMVGKVAGIAVYLKQSLPLRTGQTPLNPKGYPPPADEQMSWAYKYVGATLPEATLRDVARGQAMPEQIQALRDNWPEVVQDFQVNVMGAITAATERGHEIPRERVRQVEELMGQPGGLDPTMSVAMWQSFDAAFAQEEAKKQQKAPQSGGGGPQLASTFQTRLASVAAQRTMV